MRFGDAPIEGNRLQVKTQGTQSIVTHYSMLTNGITLQLFAKGTKLSLLCKRKAR